MKTLVATAAAAAALLLASSGAARGSADPPCVGGPHCLTTIQAALDAAQNGDVIRLAPGAYAGGIVITKSVSLVGPDAHAVRISGGGPVVTIGSKTTAPTVSLEGITITGGRTSSDPQAPNCAADVPTCGPGYVDATALGGGVETFPGTNVTLRRTIVTGNRSEPAKTVPSVKATCPSGPCPASFGDAAGIDVWGTMTLVDSTVSDNHAAAVQSNGGGILAERGAVLTLLRSHVVGNSAAAVAPFGRFVSGGGIFVARDAVLTVDGSEVSGNRVSLDTSIPHPYPMQDGGTDQANAFSAGIQLADGSSAVIRDSSIDGNVLTVNSDVGEPFGADVALCSCGDVQLAIANSSISRNVLSVRTLSSADVGPSGSIFESDGVLTMTGTTVASNTVLVATAGDAAATGTLLLLNFGGPLATFSQNVVTGNTVTAFAPGGDAKAIGGGVTNNGPLVIDRSRIDRNRSFAVGTTGGAQGGGIWNGELFAGPDSPLTVTQSRVTQNVVATAGGATASGGGIHSDQAVTLDRTVVARNAPDDCVGCG